MRHLSHIPVLRILIPFVAGIVVGIFMAVPAWLAIALLFSGFIGVLAFHFSKYFSQHFKLRYLFGIIIHLFLFSSGLLLTQLKTRLYDPYHYTQFEDAEYFLLRITEPYHIKQKSLKAEAEIEAVFENNKWRPCRGKTLLYFASDAAAKALQYADRIVTNAKPQPIAPPQNPGSFNYKRFLGFHQIHHQFYLKSGRWAAAGKGFSNILLSTAFELRKKFLNEIQGQILVPQEVAVCSALLIGFNDLLDDDLLSAYASSGALHVLSVSGLHVGLIFVILQRLIFIPENKKYLNLFKQLLILLLIWFYAMLTGLSPSVLRSATMISIIIIAKQLGRDNYMLNTTLASALLLLLINPFSITEVGFQLSYLAVIGIVYLHQRLVTVFYPTSMLMNQAWQLTSVSLCAQLVTFPLGILYFNQFPNLFLVSNLLVIPISTGIIWVSVGATIISALPYMSSLVFYSWKVTFALTWLMNQLLLFLENLPFALISGLYIDIADTWIIYGIIAFVVWFLIYNYRNALYGALTLTIIFLVTQLWHEWNILQQKNITIYALKNSTAIDIAQARKRLVIAPKQIMEDKSLLRFNINRYWYETGKREMVHIPFYQQPTESKLIEIFNSKITGNVATVQDGFIQIDSKLYFIPGNWLPRKVPLSKIKVDGIIITSRFKNKLPTLFKYFDSDLLIIDLSSRAKVDAGKLPVSLQIWDCRKQGAAQVKI